MPAFYRALLSEFLNDDHARIVGLLSSHNQHNELRKRQIRAWEKEIVVLKSAGNALIRLQPEAPTWSILLEYTIPRRSKRIDGVVLASDMIFCLEFKTEDKAHSLQSQRQAEDYALDLRDFHEESRGRLIVPVVVVPSASSWQGSAEQSPSGLIPEVRLANSSDLADIISEDFLRWHQPESVVIDPKTWDHSRYNPVPTIIEAAEALYAGHNIREIAHSHAEDKNLTVTSDRLIEIVQNAQRKSEKVICFVTGIPGAGKTLVGLNLVHNPALRREGRPAGVFLSGNGPLVRIVSEAIARDFRRRVQEDSGDRKETHFVQNVHIFIHAAQENKDKPQEEHVLVFDEAQRAWNREHNYKKNDSNESEPEILLSILDQNPNWAVLIALVGGGQEINSGEGGLSEWGKALKDRFHYWKVAVSPKAMESDASNAGHRLFADGDPGTVEIQLEPSLHLDVSMRSFRARRLAEWVEAMLEGRASDANSIISDLRDFPFAMTRSLAVARKWLRGNTRGLQHCGLVASSGGLRLRADGLELSSGFRKGNRDMYVNWFLNLPPDIRSSNQLEVAASEFDCQGLELDWVGVCWSGDFCRDPSVGGWLYRNFSGSRWGNVNNDVDKKYILNTFRVLLTRARQGLIIWVPEGDIADETRLPAVFNSTANYLANCGLPLI